MRTPQDTLEFLEALGVECRIDDEVYQLMVEANPTVKAFVAGELTLHEALFIEAYLSNGFNSAAAAKAANYTALKAKAFSSIGFHVLRRPKIREIIAKRIADKALNSDEVLAEWAEIAKANMADFLTLQQVAHPLSDEPITVAVPDMAKAAELGKLHLVKKAKMDVNGNFSIELRDQDAALNAIARHLGMFEKDNVMNLPRGLVDLMSASPEERQKAMENYRKMIDEDE